MRGRRLGVGLFLATLSMVVGCDAQDPTIDESRVQALTEGYPATFRLRSITIGTTSPGGAVPFSFRLTLGGPFFDPDANNFIFDCGSSGTNSMTTCFPQGRMFRIPEDFPGSVIAQNSVRHGSIPLGLTATIPVDIEQSPSPSWFAFQHIVFNLEVDLTTGQVRAVIPPPSVGTIKTLTTSCVTTTQDWQFCWELELPCQDPTQTSSSCTISSAGAGCPPQPGHADCVAGVPGPCIPDPFPPDAGVECVGQPYDLLPNLPPPQTSRFDDNGMLLNPRWGWQVGNADPFPVDNFVEQTSQRTTFQNTLLCEIGAPGGHQNWFDATYTGPLRWDSHSPAYKDGDYNISINPPLALNTPFAAGITPHNDQLKFIQAEFDSDETIDDFDNIAWWHNFHLAVDSPITNERCYIDGHDGVVTGLVGMDSGHSTRTELHPAHIFAVRQRVVPDPADDAWSFFFRNWGNEGFCDGDQEYIDLTTMVLRLPRPTPAQGVPVDALFDVGPGTHGVSNFQPAPGEQIFISTADNGDVLVTVTLRAPTSHTFIAGEVHLVWSPRTAGGVEPPCALTLAASALQQSDVELDAGDAEELWGESIEGMPAPQLALFNSIFKGLFPHEPVQVHDIPFGGLVSTPLPKPPPAVFQGPPRPRTLLRRRAAIAAACTALHGEIPGFPGVCQRADIGAGACIYGSKAVVIGDRVTVTRADGPAGGISNSGAGQTQIGRNAQVGPITSVGPVSIGAGATVAGAVVSASTVTVQPGAMVSGPVQQNQAVAIPNVGLAVEFPATHRRPPVFVRPHSHQVLAPGTYGFVAVLPGGTLRLVAGTYYFHELRVAPFAAVSADSSAGVVAVYVRHGLTAHGPFVGRGNTQPNLVVGVLGDDPVSIGAPFAGTLIVPNAPILLDGGGHRDRDPKHTGSFMGKSVIVDRGVTVDCSPF